MKRYFALCLTVLFLFTATLTGLAYDETYYEEVDLTPIECSIILDGKTLPCEPGYVEEYGDVYYRYTSVAEALGYKTTFSAETGRVESTYKDGTCISFDTTGREAMITYPDGYTHDVFLYYHLINVNDRLYIGYYGINSLLQDETEKRIFFDGNNEERLYIYTQAGIDSMIRSVNKKLTVLNQIQSTISNQDYTSNGTTKLTINLGSDFFGIKGSGDSVITVTSAKCGEKIYWKIENTGSGLVNLFKLLENVYDIDTEKFPSSESMEFFSDGDHFYLKDPSRTKTMLDYDDYYYGFTEEFPEETNAILNEWIYSEEMQEAWMEYFLYTPDLGTFIVNYAFDNAYERAPEETISILLSLLSDKNLTVKKTAQGKTYTYKLDKNALVRALEPTLSAMTEDEKTEFEENMALFDINITVKQNTKQTGATSTAKGEISVSNIQNPWNEQVFSMDISLESSQTYSFAKGKTFSFPDVSNAVNITEYMENILIEHDVFYDDEYYYEDYEDYE